MQFRVQAWFSSVAGMVLMLVLTSICIFAQTQSAESSAPSEGSKSDAITGRVVNDSGQPLPNAVVWARAAGATGPPQVTSTDREGMFKLSGLTRGSYSISASLPAYIPAPRPPDSTPPAPSQVGDSVTLVLIKGGVITGRVTTLSGDPLAEVGVLVRMIRDQYGRRLTSGAMVKAVGTDDRGIYRIYGIPTGTYIVRAGGSSEHTHGSVDAFYSDVPTYAPSSTRDTAAEINVRAGEESTDVDIRYRGEQGRIISGTVAGPVFEDSGFNVTLNSITDPDSQSDAFQQENRAFEFIGVADGDYYLTAQSYAPGGERGLSESKLIRVKGADLMGIELVTRPMATISGRVVLEESKVPECSDKGPLALKETFISAWHKEYEAAKNQPRFVWGLGAPVPPDAQGNVTLKNLAPGQYYFAARLPAKHWYLQSVSFASPAAKASKPVDAARTWTNVKVGDKLSGLTVTLAKGAASIDGQVALKEGETLPERLAVYLVPVEKERADDPLRYYAGAAGPDGKITMNSIAPGRYWVLAQPPGDEADSPVRKLRWPDETETRARLRRDAEAAKTEIELKPCQSSSVTVKNF
jgi:hypothetical protein